MTKQDINRDFFPSLFNNEKYSDFYFKFDKKKLFAHSLILRKSEFFNKYFNSEITNKECYILDSIEEFYVVLKILYYIYNCENFAVDYVYVIDFYSEDEYEDNFKKNINKVKFMFQTLNYLKMWEFYELLNNQIISYHYDINELHMEYFTIEDIEMFEHHEEICNELKILILNKQNMDLYNSLIEFEKYICTFDTLKEILCFNYDKLTNNYYLINYIYLCIKLNKMEYIINHKNINISHNLMFSIFRGCLMNKFEKIINILDKNTTEYIKKLDTIIFEVNNEDLSEIENYGHDYEDDDNINKYYSFIYTYNSKKYIVMSVFKCKINNMRKMYDFRNSKGIYRDIKDYREQFNIDDYKKSIIKGFEKNKIIFENEFLF